MPSSIAFSLFLEAAIKGTAILGVASIVASLLRSRSAATRHLLWITAFVAVLMLPLLSILLPSLRFPLPSVLSADELTFYSGAAFSPSAGVRSQHLIALGTTGQAATRIFNWPAWLLGIWAVGAAFSFSRMLLGLLSLARLRKNSRTLTVPGLASLAKLLGVRRQVDCLQQTAGDMPITYGVFRPIVCLPPEANEWTGQRLRVVLLHELAHVRRRDAAAHLLGRTMVALYWWNPLAWWAWNESLKERERAADDLVLNTGASATDYAGHLLEIARSMQVAAAFQPVAIAVARGPQLETRLSSILDSRQNRQAPRRAFALLASLAAIALVIPVAALRAKSSAVQSAATGLAANSLAAAFIKQGDEASELAKPDDAKLLYRKALDVSSAGPEAAAASMALGIAELGTRNFEAAIGDFERASLANPVQAGEATMWMALTQQRQKNLETADELFRKALAAEIPGSAPSAATMELYAKLLDQENRPDEAKVMRNDASAIRRSLAAEKTSAIQPSSQSVYKIGGEVKAPTLISKIEPKYSQEARIAQYSGTDLLAVEINENGIAENIRVVRGLGFGLDQKAIEAVQQWRFNPAVKNGQPVRVTANIEVNFRLL